MLFLAVEKSNTQMKKLLVTLILSVFCSILSNAQPRHVRWTYESKAIAENLFQISITAEPDPGWHVYDTLKTDPHAYAEAFGIQYRNTDAVNGRAIIESYGDRWLVQNPPMPPLDREELDRVYALPYTRTFHPDYREQGGVPAIEEVRFSITHNRGCFGGCNFCALAFHQGRSVRSRSRESVLAEAKKITQMPDFKGYIHDVGGPTANFRYPSCDRQLEHGVCPNRKCLAPKPCPHLKADHSEYAALLRDIAALPGVKRVFVRSGIRFDYLMADPDRTFFRQLVRDHVSGQLKVAPEHCSDHTLAMMGKPPIRVICPGRGYTKSLNVHPFSASIAFSSSEHVVHAGDALFTLPLGTS